MRESILVIITSLTFVVSKAQTTAIADANFEQALIDLGLDSGTPNGMVPTANIDTLTNLDVSYYNINSLSGIEYFTALAVLNCSWNQITTLDVTQNTQLIDLNCRQNQQLSSIDVTQNQLLEKLDCGQSQITNLNITQNTSLGFLSLRFLGLTALDVSQNLSLTWLDCYQNQLTILDVTNNTSLIHLNCEWNQLTNIDVTQNSNLTNLACGNNLLTNIDVSTNTLLESLSFDYNQLISLNISNNSLLDFLSGWNNQLTTINISQNPLLWVLGLSNNMLSEIDVSQNPLLESLTCDGNQLTCLNVKNGNNTNFNGFQAINNPNLTCIEVDDPSWSTTNWVLIDPQTTFSSNCTNPCSVGIEESNLSKLSLYPNPTTGKFTIDLGVAKQNIKATLTNSIGQVILSENYTSTNFINLDINAPNGIYFLQLESDGEVITKKIIKE